MSNNSNIEEIPLDAEPQIPEAQDIQEPVEENNQETVQSVESKRGRGRPKGSLNKAKPPPPAPKPKPAPKTKAKRKPPPPEYESDSSEDGYQAPQSQYDSRQIAAEVLGLLQQQRHQNTAARRNHYASWFQNM